jgi:ferric-dicitrate binding protein FerR (iron transport regulator)
MSQNFNNDLIANILKDKLSQVEQEEVQEFLNRDIPEEELHAFLGEYWERLEGNPRNAGEFDAEKSLQAIHKQLNVSKLKSSTGQTGIFKIQKRWMRIAAMLIPFIVVAGLAYFLTSRLSVRNITVQSAVNQRMQAILPDGSTVWLNAGSQLNYTSEFGKKLREVSLKGEAFFSVQPDAQHPFIVRANEVQIRVLGTRFNLLAYPDENTIETTLESGKIEYSDQHNPPIDIIPGQQVVFTPSDKKVIIREVDSDHYISWHNNQLKFRNDSLGFVLRKMEHWYGCRFSVKDKDLLSLHFTATIQNESIEEVLDLLSESIDITYKQEGNLITIHKKRI